LPDSFEGQLSGYIRPDSQRICEAASKKSSGILQVFLLKFLKTTICQPVAQTFFDFWFMNSKTNLALTRLRDSMCILQEIVSKTKKGIL